MGRIRKSKRTTKVVITYIILSIAVIICVFPYFWMFISSIKPEKKIATIPPIIFKFKPTFANWVFVIKHEGFIDCLKNSLVVSLGSSFLGIFAGSLAGYGLTRFRYRGRETLAHGIFSMRFLPYIAITLPLFTIMGYIKLSGTRIGLILAYQMMHLPYMTWLMRSFFMEIPITIEEAAMVDGLTRWGTFFRIALPMAAPGAASALLLGIIASWNQYLIPLLLAGRDIKPLTLGLYRYVGGLEDPMQWGLLAAWAFLTVTPVIVLSVVVRKHLCNAFVRGSG